jgi:hypothetical protein
MAYIWSLELSVEHQHPSDFETVDSQTKSTASFSDNNCKSFQLLGIMSGSSPEIMGNRCVSSQPTSALEPEDILLTHLNPRAPEFVPRVSTASTEIDNPTPRSSTVYGVNSFPEWRHQPACSNQRSRSPVRGDGDGNRNSKLPSIVVPAYQYQESIIASNNASAALTGFSPVQHMELAPAWTDLPSQTADVSPRALPRNAVFPMLHQSQYQPYQPYQQASYFERWHPAPTAPLFQQIHTGPVHMRNEDSNRNPPRKHKRAKTSSQANGDNADEDTLTGGPGPIVYTREPSVPGLSPIVHGSRQADRDLFNLTGFPIDRAMLKTHVMNLSIGMRQIHSSRGLCDWATRPEFDVGYAQRVMQFDSMHAPDLEGVIERTARRKGC